MKLEGHKEWEGKQPLFVRVHGEPVKEVDDDQDWRLTRVLQTTELAQGVRTWCDLCCGHTRHLVALLLVYRSSAITWQAIRRHGVYKPCGQWPVLRMKGYSKAA